MNKDSHYEKLRARVRAVKENLDVPLHKVLMQKFPDLDSNKVQNVLSFKCTCPEITNRLEELTDILKP